ncbi:34042_t:CDS:2 [Gigaspora margarita]|uniref:34042_t:CDS:1 n=1 Tax=Gigaspora margarita TaxID=4874 RepID=A0ABN7US44_GIGMA|nr:34042_t:CDS:2 [Gigaspora margarita]
MIQISHAFLNSISYTISHHVRLEFNIEQGLDIELAIEGIRGTSVAHLEPECPKEIHPDRLTVDQLKMQLKNHKVSYNDESTKQDMISILNDILSQESEFQETELSAEVLNSNEESEFPLALGWALKETQKFGKRGGGKRISKHVITYLEGYFLAGNINKSDRYTAEEMHTELLELVKVDSLEKSDVPKVSTIQN